MKSTILKYYKRDTNVTQDDLLFNTLKTWNEDTKWDDNEEYSNIALDKDESFNNCHVERYKKLEILCVLFDNMWYTKFNNIKYMNKTNNKKKIDKKIDIKLCIHCDTFKKPFCVLNY